jgi:hypothetical protein
VSIRPGGVWQQLPTAVQVAEVHSKYNWTINAIISVPRAVLFTVLEKEH